MPGEPSPALTRFIEDCWSNRTAAPFFSTRWPTPRGGTEVKLLRAVEHGEVLPVGAGEPIQVDLRVISATHQHLPDLVADGSFRHDLYFRLSTFQIDVPPLRNRSDDIPALAEHFIHMLSEKNAAPAARLSPEALAELMRRPWHGNVADWRNAIEHALSWPAAE